MIISESWEIKNFLGSVSRCQLFLKKHISHHSASIETTPKNRLFVISTWTTLCFFLKTEPAFFIDLKKGRSIAKWSGSFFDPFRTKQFHGVAWAHKNPWELEVDPPMRRLIIPKEKAGYFLGVGIGGAVP